MRTETLVRAEQVRAGDLVRVGGRLLRVRRTSTHGAPGGVRVVRLEIEGPRGTMVVGVTEGRTVRALTVGGHD